MEYAVLSNNAYWHRGLRRAGLAAGPACESRRSLAMPEAKETDALASKCVIRT
jgi:hypothetical protein